MVVVPADVVDRGVRVDGNRVVVTYDLDADEPVPVRVRGSADGGKTWDLKMEHLTGDVGEQVAPGKGKTIVWEVLRDYPRGARLEAIYPISLISHGRAPPLVSQGTTTSAPPSAATFNVSSAYSGLAL